MGSMQHHATVFIVADFEAISNLNPLIVVLLRGLGGVVGGGDMFSVAKITCQHRSSQRLFC